MTSRPAVDAVQVRDLSFAYGKGPEILDIPELTVSRGERVFLHGPSGTGKTTLLGVMAGILAAKKGHVAILGEELIGMSSHARDRLRGSQIGYIFQMFNLIPYLSVLGNITLPCQLSPTRRQRLSGQSPEDAARELAKALGIGALLDRKVTSLSVGQQQRVAAARALIGAPALVIADEPTSALDSDHREAFLKLLFAEAEKRGSSILFVSHDHALAPLFGRTIALKDINRARQAGVHD